LVEIPAAGKNCFRSLQTTLYVRLASLSNFTISEWFPTAVCTFSLFIGSWSSAESAGSRTIGFPDGDNVPSFFCSKVNQHLLSLHVENLDPGCWGNQRTYQHDSIRFCSFVKAGNFNPRRDVDKSLEFNGEFECRI